MNIKLTDFALRHFTDDFIGTKIRSHSTDEFQKSLLKSFPIINEGYAPFCKLVAIPNFTDAKVGSLPITPDNEQFIKSGYVSRRNDELPTLSRWLELPDEAPRADWLILVLYSKEQIEAETNDKFDSDWGIVSILAQTHPGEEPMKPDTMIRNAGYNTYEYIEQLAELFITDPYEMTKLSGILSGGSGEPLNKEKYLESVKFWETNITIR